MDAGRAVPAKVGLSQALSDERIVSIAGQTPGETVALIEYLLAILYAAGHYPETVTGWLRWVERSEPLAPAAEWLSAQPSNHWDLFDPEQPLGQNANLAPFLDTYGVGPAQIVIEQVGDYSQFFDHHHLHHPAPMPADAAFRAMLTQHAYGPGGRAMIKAKDMGVGAALTNQAVTRLCGRVRVLALGDTLADTLRLNLAPVAEGPGTFNRSWTDGRIRRTFAAVNAREARMPDGPADLHSVLGRSIIMRPVVLEDGTLGVDRVLMGAGESLKPLPAELLQDAVTISETTDGKKIFLKPSAERDLWRESYALYAAVAERDKGTDLYSRLALLAGRRVHLWAVGLLARQTKVTTWMADTFPYIPGLEAELRQAASDGSAIAEYAAKALYAAAATAREIAYPNAKPADKKIQIARFNGQPEMWAGAAAPFHTLMDAVADGTPPGDALADYAADIYEIATEALTDRLSSLPPNGRGFKARAEAQQRLRTVLTGTKSPHHLREAARA